MAILYDATTGEVLSPGIEAEYQFYVTMGGTQEAFWADKNAEGIYVTDVAPGALSGLPPMFDDVVSSVTDVFGTKEAAFAAAAAAVLVIFLLMRGR